MEELNSRAKHELEGASRKQEEQLAIADTVRCADDTAYGLTRRYADGTLALTRIC